MKKDNKKKQEKNNTITLIICFVILFLIVMNLENINNLLSKNHGIKIEIEETKETIPSRYQCSYGPIVDTFYNYIKSEFVVFDFDKDGKVSKITTEEKYQATTIEEYNMMLTLLSIPTENVSYDTENYIVTINDNSVRKFPNDYKSLNKYLSKNQYICSKE